MRMFIRIGIGLALLAALGLGILILFFDSIASSALETGSEAALGVETSVGGVLLRPIAGHVRISDLDVANPDGFSDRSFMTIGVAEADVEVRSLLRDPVVIHRFVLRDIEVSLEWKLGGTNYDVILDYMDDPAAESAAEDAGPGQVIEVLRIENVKAHLKLDGVGGKSSEFEVEVPEIELRGIGRDSPDGISIAGLSRLLTTAILRAVVARSRHLPVDVIELQGRLRRLAVRHGLEESEGRVRDLLEDVRGVFSRDD